MEETLAGYGSFVTFVKSNAKALSTAVPSIKSTLAPSGGTETFTPVSLPEYIPNHHNTVSLQDTILLQDSFPFWSEPIHHQATLPGILHSEILYQSIDLMIIIHIFCYNCYILIFLLSLCQSPFIYRFRRGALNQGSLFNTTNKRKEQKTMMKAMEKRQEARKNQEKTLKRMMAYQKKAEQMVSRKRMNHHMIRKG